MNNSQTDKKYEYYKIGETHPVRLTFNSSGLKIGAEAPDPDTGELIAQPKLLSRLEQNPDAIQIPKVEFDALLARAQQCP